MAQGVGLDGELHSTELTEVVLSRSRSPRMSENKDWLDV